MIKKIVEKTEMTVAISGLVLYVVCAITSIIATYGYFCIHQENGINCLKVSVPLMMLGIALYSGAGMLCIIHDKVARRKERFHA